MWLFSSTVLNSFLFSAQALITQARTKQAATMSEVEWRGRTVPVKIDKARIFLLGLADNEAAIAQVSHGRGYFGDYEWMNVNFVLQTN